VEALFPDGHTQHDQSAHNRWHLFELVIVKLTRYANNYDSGGHEDSVDDMIVYLSMLGQLDAELQADLSTDAPTYGTPDYWSADWWGESFQVDDIVVFRHHWGKGQTFRVVALQQDNHVQLADAAGNTCFARQAWLRPASMAAERADD
jgi:hypothetical protein